jgi:hypothetical protein
VGGAQSMAVYLSFIPFFVDVDLSGWNLITHVPGGQDLEKDLAILFSFSVMWRRGEEDFSISHTGIQN